MSTAAHAILDALSSPGRPSTVGEIAEATGLPPRVVLHWLFVLRADHQVDRYRVRRQWIHSLWATADMVESTRVLWTAALRRE